MRVRLTFKTCTKQVSVLLLEPGLLFNCCAYLISYFQPQTTHLTYRTYTIALSVDANSALYNTACNLHCVIFLYLISFFCAPWQNTDDAIYTVSFDADTWLTKQSVLALWTFVFRLLAGFDSSPSGHIWNYRHEEVICWAGIWMDFFSSYFFALVVYLNK